VRAPAARPDELAHPANPTATRAGGVRTKPLILRFPGFCHCHSRWRGENAQAANGLPAGCQRVAPFRSLSPWERVRVRPERDTTSKSPRLEPALTPASPTGEGALDKTLNLRFAGFCPCPNQWRGENARGVHGLPAEVLRPRGGKAQARGLHRGSDAAGVCSCALHIPQACS